MWLIFKLILEKVFPKEKPLSQALLQHCNENWIHFILGLLIRVSFSSTFFSNLRHCQQLRSFHRALSTIWSFTLQDEKTSTLTWRFLLTIVHYYQCCPYNNSLLSPVRFLSALSNSIIIFSSAECTLLLLYIKLMLEPGFFGNNIIVVSFLHLLLS